MNTAKLFISHSSKDEVIVNAFVRFMRGIGIDERNIISSTTAGTQIKTGAPLYESLRNILNDENVFVIFLLSENFYNSTVCLNEMGAVWIKQIRCQYIILPGFSFDKVHGVITEMNLVGISLAPINTMTKARFSDFKDTIEGLFHIQISSNLWERERDSFFGEVETYKAMRNTNSSLGGIIQYNPGIFKVNMNEVEGLCIGAFDHEGCKIESRKSDDRRTVGIIDFSLTSAELSSICFSLLPKPDWRQYYKARSSLCFSAYMENGSCQVDVEIKLEDAQRKHPILVTEDRVKHKIPLEQFCTSEMAWERVREICFLFHRKHASMPLEIVIEDLYVG